jgi:hypothetical protein
MVSRSGPISVLLRRLAIAGGVLVVAMTAPAVASATPPTSFTFDDSFTGVDPDVCAAYGFDVNVVYHQYGIVRTFYASDGAVTQSVAQVNEDVTLSANGKMLVERDRWLVFFNPDGSTKNVGVPTHIQGPGGVVLLDAGRLVQAADGTPLALDGPHPTFFGATFCGTLAP